MSNIDSVVSNVSKQNVEPVYQKPAVDKNEPTFSKDKSEKKSVNENRVVDISKLDFSRIISNVNQVVRNVSTKVTFIYDERTTRPVILVADKETGKIIRQIPPEEMLELLAKLEDIAGIIYQGKV